MLHLPGIPTGDFQETQEPGRMYPGYSRPRPKDGACGLPGWRSGKRSRRWREHLVDIEAAGIPAPPEVAVGDGGMEVWKAPA